MKKLATFLLLPVSALNTVEYNYIAAKTVVEKFSFSKLKIEKVKFFTQSPIKIFCISIFNVEGGLASFRPFLMLDP